MNIKEVLSVLHPSRYSSEKDFSISYTTRFSPLLLEHGEQDLQDWAVCASSSIVKKIWNEDRDSDHSVYFHESLSPEMSKTSSRGKKDKEASTHMNTVEGRLRLCTKCLIFEPNDISRAIIRISFDKMFSPPQNDMNSVQPTHSITFTTKRITLMMKNNIIAPYENVNRVTKFNFTFIHSSTNEFLSLTDKLFSVSAISDLQNVLRPIFDQTFDATNFHHIHEQPLTSNLRAFLITPLRKQAGCVIITKEWFYFQPFHGVDVTVASKAMSWKLSDIVATARRYHGLKDEGLEIFFVTGPSLLISFEGYENREDVMEILPNRRSVCGRMDQVFCHTDLNFLDKVVTAWRTRNIDNFEYLLALNSAAGRSFQDLSRYPVFPWVLSDYTSDVLDLQTSSVSKQLQMFRDLSKPIGALNSDRLQHFSDRFKLMQKDMGTCFLYGTHFSAPGYCLYYLVRTMPEQMLCLQNGKYDSPDRLFYDIAQCYSSILSNPADIKECIPQFYDPKSGMNMLLNIRGLQLGVTQKSVVIGDVTLPPWARNPKDFLKKNRNALESDYVTRHLSSWIDLIFGVKSRGEKALSAMNLFHPTAYLTPEDLDKMETGEKKMQAELQATEFGICPDMLFNDVHPDIQNTTTQNSSFLAINSFRKVRKISLPNDALFPSSKRLQKKIDESLVSKVSLAESIEARHHDTISPLADDDEIHTLEPIVDSYHQSDDNVIATREPNAIESAKVILEKNTNAKSIQGFGSPFTLHSAQQHSRDFRTSHDEVPSFPVKIESSLNIESISDDCDRKWKLTQIALSEIHGSDITGCQLIRSDHSYIVTTSLDGGLLVSSVPKSEDIKDKRRHSFTLMSPIKSPYKVETKSNQPKFHNFRSHHSSDPLSCLAVVGDDKGGYIAFAGGHDDIVLAYGINSACGLESIYSHRDVVSGIHIIPYIAKNSSSYIMVTGSWDATVKLWDVTVTGSENVTIVKDPIVEFYDADSQVECLDCTRIHDSSILVAAGCADHLIVWSWDENKGKTIIHTSNTKEVCSVLKWIANINGDVFLLVGFNSGRLSCYSLKNNQLYPVSKRHMGSRLSCVTTTSLSSNMIFFGCDDGNLRMLSLGEMGELDSDPYLFPSINGTHSPKLTSISASLEETSQGTRYIVAAGAEDGYLSLNVIEERM